MKKFLAYINILVLGLMLCACPGPELPESYDVNISVNVEGVISPFTYEVSKGELSTLSSNHKIRLRTFIYDDKENLVKSATEYLSNYTSRGNSSFMLAPGSYTAVAISDVVKYDGSTVELEYWKLSGESKLTTTKVTDCGMIGGSNKILGISNQSIFVSESNVSANLSLKPAGALTLVFLANLDTYKNATKVGIVSNRSCDYATLTTSGSFDAAVESASDFKWWFALVDRTTWTDTYFYHYYFSFPMSNASYAVYAVDKNDKSTKLSNSWVVSPKIGEEYGFLYDLKSKELSNGLLNSGTRATMKLDMVEGVQELNDAAANQSVMLKSLFENE